jgi:phosphatidylinositol-3-phosphatase
VARRLTVLLGIALALCLAAPGAAPAAPPIKHVWIVVLENEDAASTFGPASEAPYLARTLTAQGLTLPNYFAVTHESLGNYLAMISGQASNPQTQADCQVFTEFTPALAGADGQALGQGCVYPASVPTIANQLTARGLGWKGYMEDMGNTAGQPATCRHPAIGAADSTQHAKVGDQYAARHNPFVYFHSVIDGPMCAERDVPLDRLPGDLASAGATPSYSFVTPNLCDDAHDSPCVDGRPGGLASADAFLRAWIPRITGSAAYKQGGLVIVTFDEAEGAGEDADSSACCDQQPGPNTPSPGGTTPGPGGGRIGAVLLSPWIKPGTVSTTPYNHYALLRSTEDLFGLGHLGYAGRAGLASFGADVYNGPGPARRDRFRPRLRITGVPRRCTRRRLRVRVRVTEGSKLRRAALYRDRRKVRATRRKRYSFVVNAKKLRRGRHSVRAVAVDAAGNRGTTTRRFRRCG